MEGGEGRGGKQVGGVRRVTRSKAEETSAARVLHMGACKGLIDTDLFARQLNKRIHHVLSLAFEVHELRQKIL